MIVINIHDEQVCAPSVSLASGNLLFKPYRVQTVPVVYLATFVLPGNTLLFYGINWLEQLKFTQAQRGAEIF